MATKASSDHQTRRKPANDTDGGRFGGAGIMLGAAAVGIVAGVVANPGH